MTTPKTILRAGLSRLAAAGAGDTLAVIGYAARGQPKGLAPAVDRGRGKLHLYDPIDDWLGTGPTLLVEALSEMADVPVDLYVNSPGGDVWDARAMAGLLSRHDHEVVAYVDGICASAATTVTMGADRILAYEGSRYMIHNSSTIAVGGAAELAKAAELCEAVDGDIANDYHRRTGIDLDTIRGYMADETYFSAADAAALGFCDEVVQRAAADAPANNAPPSAETLRRFAAALQLARRAKHGHD